MFLDKKDIFTRFYMSAEGKKIIAYAELFLSELTRGIQDGSVHQFSRDYRFQTNEYEFMFCFSKLNDNVLVFRCYGLREDYEMFVIYFDTLSNTLMASSSFLIYKTKRKNMYLPVVSLRLFDGVLLHIRKLWDARIIDFPIAKEQLTAIENEIEKTPLDALKETKDWMNAHRKDFEKETFAHVAHTIKTIEKTLHLTAHFDEAVIIKELIEEFHQMVAFELERVFHEHHVLPRNKQAANEEQLLVRLHPFFLKAIKIQEYMA